MATPIVARIFAVDDCARYMIRFIIVSLGLIVAPLAACDRLEAPETGARVPPGVLAAEYPELLTARQIAALSGDMEMSELSLEEQRDLKARLARLRARAEALEGDVLTDEERAALDP